MGMLDNIKDALSKDDAERAEDAKEAADEAKQKADEAQRKADEAAAQADGSDEVHPDAVGVDKVEKKKKPVQKKKPAPKPKKVVYTVKPGDTLSAIGAKYGVDWRDIARVNKIPNPDLIYPGQQFVIPGK